MNEMRLAVAVVLAVATVGCIDVGSIQSRQPPPDADASTMENDAGLACDPGCTPTGACVTPPPEPGTSLVSGLEIPCGLVDPVDGRDGVWFTYGNGDSLVNPMPGSLFTPRCDVGAQGSCHAACFSGRIAGDNYPYAMLALNFKKIPAPYHMSAYSGVSFYLYGMITQHGQVPSQIRFAVRTSGDSDPGTGGTCMSGCNDPYQLTINSAPPVWTKFTVPFSQLMQVGFGTRFTFDPHTGIGMGWSVVAGPGQQVLTGDDYTLCVDQVAFVSN